MGLVLRSEKVSQQALSGPASNRAGACGHTSPRTENPRRSVSVSTRRGWGPAASEKKLVTFSAAIGIAVASIAGQPQTTPVYTAAQAAAGRTAYLASCAGCHGPELSGRN